MLPSLHASSAPPDLHTSTPTRASRPPNLHASMSRYQQSSLQTSIPRCFHGYTRAAHLSAVHASMYLHRYDDGATSELRSSIPPRLHICTPAATLRSPCFHVFTLPHQNAPHRVLRFHASTSLHLDRASSAPCFDSSTPPRLHAGSGPLGLQASILLCF